MIGQSLDYQVGPHELGLKLSRLSAAPAVVGHPDPVPHLIEGRLIRVLSPYLPLPLSKYFLCDPHSLYQLSHILMHRVIMVGNVIGQVVRDPGLLTKHQEVRGLTSTGVRSTAVGSHDLRKYNISFLATTKEQALERISQHAFVTLHNPITLRVVLLWFTPPPKATEVAHKL